MRPHVSLIIPVHNAEPFLERCLDSAAAQTEPELEIICVDDASTDASGAMLEERAKRDKRFRVVHRAVNGGESAARNEGVALARGEYLAFLDHDDMLEPDACRLLYRAAKGANADIAKGRVRIFGYDEKIVFSPLKLHFYICNLSRFYFTSYWWSAIYRTSMVRGNISFAEKYPLGADILFLVESLIASRKVFCIDNLVYNYLRRPDSGDSLYLSHDKILSVIAINMKILNLLNRFCIYDTDKIGYMIQTMRCFSRGINHIIRSIDKESRKICCDYIFDLIDSHKFPEELALRIKDDFPLVYSVIYEQGKNAFRRIAIDDMNTFTHITSIIAKLRYLSVEKMKK